MKLEILVLKLKDKTTKSTKKITKSKSKSFIQSNYFDSKKRF